MTIDARHKAPGPRPRGEYVETSIEKDLCLQLDCLILSDGNRDIILATCRGVRTQPNKGTEEVFKAHTIFHVKLLEEGGEMVRHLK